MVLVPAMFYELTKNDILQLDPQDCRRTLTKEELEMIFKACDAFWHHPGKRNPKAPHAILATGKHSNVCVCCPQVLQRSNLSQIMAMQLLYLLYSVYPGPIDWVTGSDSSALGLSKDVANLSRANWHPMQKGPHKTQIWEKATVLRGNWMLHIEGLLATGLTAQAVRDGVKKNNIYPVNFVPFIPLLVHQPDKTAPGFIDDSKLISLLHYNTYEVDPQEEACELCEKGSQALPVEENWDELVTTM